MKDTFASFVFLSLSFCFSLSPILKKDRQVHLLIFCILIPTLVVSFRACWQMSFHEGYDMSVYFQFLSAVSIFTVLLAVERSFASTGSQFLFPTPRALYTYVFPIRFLCGDLILPCWLLVHKVHTYMLNGWKNL